MRTSARGRGIGQMRTPAERGWKTGHFLRTSLWTTPYHKLLTHFLNVYSTLQEIYSEVLPVQVYPVISNMSDDTAFILHKNQRVVLCCGSYRLHSTPGTLHESQAWC